MGEYVGIRIKNYDFIMYKNSFYDLLSVFSKEEIKIGVEKDDEGEDYKKYCFVSNVYKIKLVLDSLGYTIENAKCIFEKNKAYEVEYAKEYENEDWEFELEWTSKEIETHFTFDEWKKAVHKFAILLSEDTFDMTIGNYKALAATKEEELSVADRVVLKTLPFGDGYFGIREEVNVWPIFRVILDAFDDKEEVVLDYTNLYYGGWCEEYPEEKDYYAPKTIVLTEGKFDVEVIQESMQILYPHMTKYYSFMNFTDYKVQGSTNFLTHYLKAFIGAGIENRVIAIYDNDSAGMAELIGIKHIKLPENFRVFKLPSIELAESYPTLGPNGKENMNINERACSIEMFLGKDVLMEENEFIPIQWKGYVEKTETYQGEIMNKSLVQ